RILILVSARPALLLPTVRSRCRRLRFEPITVEPMADLLERQRGLSPEQARVLAAMSGGSMGKALSMEAAKFMELREKIVGTLAHPGLAGVREILELSVDVSSDRNRALEAIEIASTWIRDVLIEKAGCDHSMIVHGDFLDRISETAQHHTSKKLLAVYHELARASEMVEAATNINRNLITDVTLLKISRMLGEHPDASHRALG
ncbi:MAG: DNA polymerase III subunit delta' C-terminal domain-containing protein, partial [Deltaproteobacteria bacterium]